MHVRPDRLELDGEREAVAQRPVGVREAAEQVGVLVVGGRADDPAVTGQDLHLGDRLVRHAVAQRGGLDAEPGDRAAEGDRLELGHHQRHQLVRERRVAEVLVGGHAPDAGRPGDGVDAQHVTERGDVQQGRPGTAGGLAEPEQVGGALGQPYRRARRRGRIGLTQPGYRGLVLAAGRADIQHGHPSGKGLSPIMETADDGQTGGFPTNGEHLRQCIRAQSGSFAAVAPWVFP